MTRFVLPAIDESWHVLPLGKLAAIKYGSALVASSRATEGNVPVYGSGGIVGTHDAYLHTGKSIVIGRKGSVGSIFLTDGPFWCIDTAYYLDELSELVSLDYLAAYLQSLDLSRLAISVAIPGLNRKELAAVPIPLPTLPEQQRIVDVLRQAETLANPQQSRDRQLDLMIKAYLDRLVLAIDESEWVQLNNLVETRYGTSVSADGVVNSGAPVLRIPNVMGGEVDTTNMKYVDLSPIEVERLRLTRADVLIVRSNGNPDYVGRSAPITEDIEKAGMVYASYLIRLRADTGRLLPEYLSSFLNSAFGRAAMRHAIRTTAGQSNLSGENLTEIRIPLPTISEQKTFAAFWQEVRLLRQFMSQSDRIAKLLRAELTIFALSGELTSEWRITHQQAITAATDERDNALRERETKVSVHIEVSAPAERKPLQGRIARSAVLSELSDFQGFVFDALREWKGTLLADDMTVLDEFCRLWPIEHGRNMHDRVRRSLEQFAGLGLIAKVALPNDRGDFVIGYRMLRPEEETRSRDIARLQQLLRTASGNTGAQS
jgi:type I restriction enzyme, S subunit